MKHDPAKLIFHSLHKRPMPGCLPLFFLLSAVATGVAISVVRVVRPEPYRPLGVGAVHYRNDELTRFQVRQRSALPLRLPHFADPAAEQPVARDALPLSRAVLLQPAPPLPITDEPPDSAVLDVHDLLRLPPEEGKEAEP